MTEREQELFGILSGPSPGIGGFAPSSIQTEWVAITGAPGSGKSTICYELIKAGYKVVPEASRAAIVEAQGRGFSCDEVFSNPPLLAEAILIRKLGIARGLAPNERWIWDTGLIDALVFCRRAGMDMSRIAAPLQIFRFRSVLFLEPLPQSVVQCDVVRPQTEIERSTLHVMLHAEYEGQGYRMSQIAVGTISDRMRDVLAAIQPLPSERSDL